MNIKQCGLLRVVRPQVDRGELSNVGSGHVTVNQTDEDHQTDIQCEPCLGGSGEEDAECGVRKFRKMQDPKAPSPDEILEHNLSHLPYRSWCRHCVRGRRKEDPHQKSKDKPTMNEAHFDYAFLGKDGEPGKLLPLLVVKERITGMVLASAVPSKTTGEYITKRVMPFFQEIGCEYGDLTAKSDQEPAVMTVVRDVGRLRAANGGGRFVIENSPVASHASNGVVERAIQSVVAQVRVMLDALEAKWKVEIPYNHLVICFMIEYAAFLLNRFEVGHDGRTAFERCKGKKAKTMGIEFGEAVLWKKVSSVGALGKLSSSWDDGVFLGVRGKSGEYIVSTKAGVWKARSVQRKPAGERWNAASIELIKFVPWKTSEQDPDVDSQMPRGCEAYTGAGRWIATGGGRF